MAKVDLRASDQLFAFELADSAGQLDLTLYGGAVVSSNLDDNVDAVGFALGASGFIRLGELLGVGLVIEHYQIGWAAEGGPNIAEPSGVELGRLVACR